MNKNRMLKRIVSLGAFLAIVANAQVCKEALLYDGSSTPGSMENSSFPEMPEWSANWGYMDGLNPPYIRLSGQKSVASDWTGALVFRSLPKTVKGGTLRMKVRSTQNVNFGTWLSGKAGTGNVVFSSIPANTTKAIEIPIEKLMGNQETIVEKIWVGLFGVPQYQYETFFIDEVSLSCTMDGSSSGVSANASSVASENTGEVSDSSIVRMPKVEAYSAIRPSYFVSRPVRESSSAYSSEAKKSLRSITNKKFVVELLEHSQIQSSLQKEVSPELSRQQWFINMFIVNRHRLEDSVIANPKAVFNEAVSMAAAYDYKVMPLLVANVDYAYSYCPDTLCAKKKYGDAQLLQAGIPSSYVYGSTLKLIYDPYFVVTQKKNLPVVQVCVSDKCKNLPLNGLVDLEFESAGTQKIKVSLSEGGKTVEHNIYVEVK